MWTDERKCVVSCRLHLAVGGSTAQSNGPQEAQTNRGTIPAHPVGHWPEPPPVITGERADYAEAVLNRDDPVPSTNLPLRCAVTYDVTRAAARASFTPLPQDSLHSWPVAWYGANAEALLARAGPAPSHSVDRTRERGAVVLVP